MTPPKAVALHDSENRHLGFVLFAIPDGALEGDCAFIIQPKDESLMESPLVSLLATRQDVGDFNAIWECGDGWIARIDGQDLSDFLIELDEEGVGKWSDGTFATGIAIA